MKISNDFYIKYKISDTKQNVQYHTNFIKLKMHRKNVKG